MTALTTSRSRAALLLVAPLLCLLPALTAQAQDLPGAGTTGAAAQPYAPPPPAAAAAPAPAPAADEPEATASLGPFERLPSSAYPEWTARGIPGGSLWFSGNMHGMPWPYYPKTGIGVSGYAWLDNGYKSLTEGNPTEQDFRSVVSQGRAVLRVTPTYSRGTFYVQGQVELVGNKDQAVAQPNVADLDDLWVRVGRWKQWDLQVGRFEAYEVYHFGMGMDLNTQERDGASDTIGAPDVYGLKTIVYRQNGIGNVAYHLYPTSYLRFELLGQFGYDTMTSLDTFGTRPAAVLDFGWIKIKAEGDARKQFPTNYKNSKESQFQRGGSASVQLLGPYVEGGANVAYGLNDHYLPTNSTNSNASMGDYDSAGSKTDLDFGGFLNGRLSELWVVGLGANYNTEKNQQNGKFNHLQTFGAAQYWLGKQLFIKLVVAYAKSHMDPGGTPAWDNTMISGRIRLMYLF
jgi:hypothetical protein